MGEARRNEEKREGPMLSPVCPNLNFVKPVDSTHGRSFTKLEYCFGRFSTVYILNHMT